MTKKQLFFVILGILGFVGILVFWLLTTTQAVLLGYNGFAVDSNGNLYLGLNHQISVHSNGKLVRSITTGTSRGYAFTIDNSDHLILSTSTTIYKMDLYGNIIETGHDENARLFLNMQRNRTFTAEDGSKYVCKNTLGYIEILNNGVTVYRMPGWHYIALIAFILSIISFAIGIIMNIYYIKIEGL